MIKLPKEVARIMKTLTDAKQEAFAVGDCVRDALLGQKPIGWDVATDAGFDKLRELFPEAEVLHYLDILDARMFDMQAALENTEPGQFSEKVRTLDNRRLYKPAFAGATLADAQQDQREAIAPEQNL